MSEEAVPRSSATHPGCRLLLELEHREGITLSPIERMIMVTDGTVTHMLEALSRRPVAVTLLKHELNNGTLDRQVRIETTDGKRLLWARSIVMIEQLHESVRMALLRGTRGIGHALRDADIETRREIHSITAVDRTDTDFPRFVTDEVESLLVRTYQIYADGDQMMTITEYFPRGRF